MLPSLEVLFKNRFKFQKNLNKDGLLYADIAFENSNKGQRKLVIRGQENATEYIQVDFTKRADPLPDSDEEGDQV